ncbi:MAG TPA: orotidine-5'-phosphate decarboxylase [Verrucomicrobiae bacterium]|nr:orotidine-5'-phosphate decarboxylase [Verrucomicrobiae bacterium]
MPQTKEQIIIALDVDSKAKALNLVHQLSPVVSWFKVGMELFSAAGPDIVREISSTGAKVFVDLKFHDIPNTVSKAGAAITRLGAAMFNVHCSGGREMMTRTVELAKETAAREGLPITKIIGVTVLTSMSEAVLNDEIGVFRGMAQQVEALAVLAREAGMDGVVASPKEIAVIRKACGPQFLIVTPGVRPAWSATDDQHRIMTPQEAYELGATHLVIGRPVTGAENPREACEKIISEMEGNI